MPLDPIFLPPLFVLVATTPWWLRAVFRWWLGLVNPGWGDRAHVRSARPSQLHLVSGAADASSLRPHQPKQRRHLRLIRGGGGDALDPVA
jgi:hypothetical protein